MAEITVKICSGTACFIMSGNHLNDIAASLKAKYGDCVEVAGTNCLGMCSQSHSKAPFAQINGDIIAEASIEKLISEIDKRLKGLNGNA